MTARVCVALIWDNNDDYRKALPECDGAGDVFNDEVPDGLTPGQHAMAREKIMWMASRVICKMALKERWAGVVRYMRRNTLWEEHKDEMRLRSLAMQLMRINQQKQAAE